MAKGFFQELKHYGISDIAEKLQTNLYDAKHLVDLLKKYGIVKAVKREKPEYLELSNLDLAMGDETGEGADIAYVFDFVGVVMLGHHVFKCYPKYIKSKKEPMEELKKVLKVIQKCNQKEQLVHLYHGEDENRVFNKLAVSLWLLEDYFLHGLYSNQHEVVETNGDGEILWDKTINETFAFLKNDRPCYMELQTMQVVENEQDYVKRLHECILSLCSRELKETGMLELFAISEVEFTAAGLQEFGDGDAILYRLEREIEVQYVTRKQILLKTLYTYVKNINAGENAQSLSLYGTNCFALVWQKVCSHNFANVLEKKLWELRPKLSDAYREMANERLIDIIEKPTWYRYDGAVAARAEGTLIPDVISIYPCEGGRAYCFAILDAKYYCMEIERQGEKDGAGMVKGQPGIGDITKQYLYQLAYWDFVKKQGYQYVKNAFLLPQEEPSKRYGYVELKMLQGLGQGKPLQISVIRLCAEEMYDCYLSGRPIETIDLYL